MTGISGIKCFEDAGETFYRVPESATEFVVYWAACMRGDWVSWSEEIYFFQLAWLGFMELLFGSEMQLWAVCVATIWETFRSMGRLEGVFRSNKSAYVEDQLRVCLHKSPMSSLWGNNLLVSELECDLILNLWILAFVELGRCCW